MLTVRESWFADCFLGELNNTITIIHFRILNEQSKHIVTYSSYTASLNHNIAISFRGLPVYPLPPEFIDRKKVVNHGQA